MGSFKDVGMQDADTIVGIFDVRSGAARTAEMVSTIGAFAARRRAGRDTAELARREIERAWPGALARVWLPKVVESCSACPNPPHCAAQLHCLRVEAPRDGDDAAAAPLRAVPIGLGVIGCRARRTSPLVNVRLAEGGLVGEAAFAEANGLPFVSIFTLRASDRFFGVLSVHTREAIHAEDAAALHAVSLTLANAVGLSTMIVESDLHTASLEEQVVSKTAELRARISDMEDTRAAMWNMMSEAFETHKKLAELTRSLEETVADRTKEAIAARNEAMNANNLKSEFLSQVSHELRTPMHGIISFAKLALKKIERGSAVKVPSFLEQILGAAEELLTLINDILDLSKIEAGRGKCVLEQNDVGALVRRLVVRYDPLLRDAEIGVRLDLSRIKVDKAVFDKQKMSQVLTNVFGNAMKFSPKGGTVTISAESDERRVVYVVSDQGPGIPDSELESIFDPFVQGTRSRPRTATKGTGLGLAIARAIVREHGGDLVAANGPDGGAVFTAWIPTSGPLGKGHV